MLVFAKAQLFWKSCKKWSGCGQCLGTVGECPHSIRRIYTSNVPTAASSTALHDTLRINLKHCWFFCTVVHNNHLHKWVHEPLAQQQEHSVCATAVMEGSRNCVRGSLAQLHKWLFFRILCKRTLHSCKNCSFKYLICGSYVNSCTRQIIKS